MVIVERIKEEKQNHIRQIILIGFFFFIFGFITWINGALIPYLKIACQLQEWQAYLVTFSFYIAYTVMALPSGKLLKYTGMIGGVKWGLIIMAIGCLCFIPAALQREYFIFLIGLFIVGTGLTVLQTVVNPYITLLGSPESAARRISIMGICNKFAGVIAPVIFGAIVLKNASSLIEELERLGPDALEYRLDILAHGVILPYSVLAFILIVIALLIRFARLPEIGAPVSNETSDEIQGLSGRRFNVRLTTGFVAIFCTVGVEVVAGDTIGNYGIYHGINLDTAKMLTSYTLAAMMSGYILGILIIPRVISQERAFAVSNVLALLLLVAVLFFQGVISVYCLALLGFANALLWPAIWPQALHNLTGKQLHYASAVLVMGIAGGAILPLIYGLASTVLNNQFAYAILAPCYCYNLWYWYAGKKSLKNPYI